MSNLPAPEPLLNFDSAAPLLVGELGAVDAALASYRALRAAGRILSNSVEALRVELTYHSNAIEGSTLTLRETQLILEGRTPDSAKPLREIYEARNHDRALKLIEGWAESRTPEDWLTERDVLDIHAQVLADIDPASAGRFRTDRVLIKGTRFIPPGSYKFPALFAAILKLASRPGIHPVLQAAELHYNFVAVHPFADGNGRTARLLMNNHLLRRGYPHTIIEVERRGEYLAALEQANTGHATPFARLIVNAVHRSILKITGDDAES